VVEDEEADEVAAETTDSGENKENPDAADSTEE
jgi:hypothetical protein